MKVHHYHLLLQNLDAMVVKVIVASPQNAVQPVASLPSAVQPVASPPNVIQRFQQKYLRCVDVTALRLPLNVVANVYINHLR